MIRRLIINPVRRWFGLPVHYVLKARPGHFDLGG
jgi:hypothetical protein